MKLHGNLISLTAISFLVLLLHTFNGLLITKKRNLHKTRYYYILNLTVSDTCLVIFGFFMKIYNIEEKLLPFAHCFYFCSIITTLFISIDRYIAIKHCLYYHEIVTKKRVKLSFVVIWVTSIFANMAPFIYNALAGDDEVYLKLKQWITYFITFACSIGLLLLALYTMHLRNKHIRHITSMRIYFGITTERLGMLRHLKRSVKDVFYLNIITFLLIMLPNSFRVYYEQWAPDGTYSGVIGGIILIYMTTNPLVYAMTMSELRKHYRDFLQKISYCFHRC